jgi:acyl-CoA synthetase (NDP forming)
MIARTIRPVATLLRPASVAVVGASPKPGFNRAMIENFVSLEYPGRIAAVNPNYDDVLGIPCYRSLADLPFAPESVVVGVNRHLVIPIVEQAAEAGARSAVIFATGLGEGAGGDQAAAEQRLRDIAAASGMAILGPNCQGTINFGQPNALYMRPVQPYEPGRVALIGQSGSITTALANNRRGVRWSHVISTGNEAVTGVEEIIDELIDDPAVGTIVAFIETIRRPERFVAACDRARAVGKAVAVLKTGRSEAGAQAAVAHSGALAAPDRLIDALFARLGVIRAESLDELLNLALLLETGRRPTARGLGAVTGSGGEIEILLDEATKHGLQFPALQPAQAERLRELLPEELPPVNPLDSSDVNRRRFVENHPLVLETVQSDPQVGVLMVTMSFGPTPTGRPNPGGFKMDALKALAGRSDKLLCMIDMVGGTPEPELVEDMAGQGVAVLSGVADSLRAVRGLLDHSRPTRPTAAPSAVDRAAIDAALRSLDGRPSAGARALDVVAAAGIPVVSSIETESAEDAVRAGASLGYPLVVKVADPDVLHKTEMGGVITGIADEATLRAAVETLSARSAAPRIVVQPHLDSRVELLLGIERHPGFGPFILVGGGGIWVEVLDDVAIRPAGLLEGEAEAMLRELRIWPVLEGARDGTAAPIAAIVDAIERLDRLAVDGDGIATLDINPLLVTGTGVVAVDALVAPTSTPPA